MNGEHSRAGERSPIAIAPALLSLDQAAEFLGVSARKFQELRADAWMVRPIMLGPKLLRWSRAELEAAVANMPRLQAAGAEPTKLLRARIERAKATGDLR